MESYISKITDLAAELGLDIVDYQMIGDDLLELGIARKDFEPVDIELCEQAAAAFAEALDYEIGLDVGSAGAEREILPENFHDIISQYVFVQFSQPFQGGDNVEGYLKAVDDEEIEISYRVKTRDVTIRIPRVIVKMLRLAVKV